jgi:TetR/AcrR family transcriptional regulator, regulator of cefoperazone and chloramphenicol sensitivity
MAKQRDAERTKAAIIEAAGQLFADHGFSGVTAREVAAAAKVSLSAIPYHFGSMESLYLETLLQACSVDSGAARLSAAGPRANPREAFRLAVRWAVTDIGAIRSSWQMRLIQREDFDPSPAFKHVIQHKFVPEWKWLCDAAARATSGEAHSQAVQFGVIVMYVLIESLLHRHGAANELAAKTINSLKDREKYSELITCLALDAIKHYERIFVARAEGASRKTK